jgi:hypothetical protein
MQKKVVDSYISDVLLTGGSYNAWHTYWLENFDKLESDDYTLQIKFSKNGDEYDFGTMQGQLSRQFLEHYSRVPNANEVINYYNIINTYTGKAQVLLDDIYNYSPEKYRINYKAYYNYVKSIFNILSISDYEGNLFGLEGASK